MHVGDRIGWSMHAWDPAAKRHILLQRPMRNQIEHYHKFAAFWASFLLVDVRVCMRLKKQSGAQNASTSEQNCLPMSHVVNSLPSMRIEARELADGLLRTCVLLLRRTILFLWPTSKLSIDAGVGFCGWNKKENFSLKINSRCGNF